MSATRLASATIKIPKRIERGPLDILRALASTVKYNPENPDIIIHDDPYLMPRSLMQRASFAVSKISGKKAAKFLLNRHPELFYRDDSEPKVREFNFPEQFTDDMTFTIEDLKWSIKERDPANGIIAYKALVERDGISIDEETLLDFFELICYTNEEPMFGLLDHQELFFLRSDTDLMRQNWRNDGIASKIFNKIKQDVQPARVYTAMIAGLSKHNEHSVAKEIFDEFREHHPDKGLYVDAYNYLISSIPNLNSSVAGAQNALNEIVQHMESHLVRPNLKVFNSILDVYHRFDCDPVTNNQAFKLINDMKSLNVAPSLATCAGLVSILYRSGKIRHNINVIKDLITIAARQDIILEIRDERDVYAMREMMRIFATRLHNSDLSQQLFRIYLRQPRLFDCTNSVSSFFDNYFSLLVKTETLDKILSFYDSYVPKQFRPSVKNYEDLLEALALFQADEETVKRIHNDIEANKIGDRLKKKINPTPLELLAERLDLDVPRSS